MQQFSSEDRVKKQAEVVVFADLWSLTEVAHLFGACAAMAVWGRSPLLLIVTLSMSFGRAVSSPVSAALAEPQICYILDGILFLYGIILTALYCRIKILHAKESEAVKGKQKAEESIYTGLTPHAQDTYETIGMKK
ncbi:high affinity immunoglobulin epsilon receptor subunit gamma isoform X1 [Halichoeres trimaculatus]|uniref:high affinity immunoglobulin epsilon receptor subunit gamma isoform X1 n=1 Tax=Halichoeres trimaculatus TaxID=147232 RepID=UPI003D9F79A8